MLIFFNANALVQRWLIPNENGMFCSSYRPVKLEILSNHGCDSLLRVVKINIMKENSHAEVDEDLKCRHEENL